MGSCEPAPVLCHLFIFCAHLETVATRMHGHLIWLNVTYCLVLKKDHVCHKPAPGLDWLMLISGV